MGKLLSAEAGTLWRYKPPKLLGKWCNVAFNHDLILFTGLHAGMNMSKYPAEENKNYFIVDVNKPIINLKEELPVNKLDSAIDALPKNKELRKIRIAELKRLPDKFDYYYKIIAYTTIEEIKVGWITRTDSDLLVPFKEINNE